MNETRKAEYEVVRSRAPHVRLERQEALITASELPRFSDDTVRAPRAAAKHARPRLSENPEKAKKNVKLSGAERARYAVTGSLWTAAGLLVFGLDMLVMGLDAGVFDVIYATAGYLALKQFKAAISGVGEKCLKFKCTFDIVRKKAAEIIEKVKDSIGAVFGGAKKHS